jgi:hypothetical protein
MSTRDRYEEGYRDGLAAAATPGMDDPDRVAGAHNAGQLDRADLAVMSPEQINENWAEAQRVLAGEQ